MFKCLIRRLRQLALKDRSDLTSSCAAQPDRAVTGKACAETELIQTYGDCKSSTQLFKCAMQSGASSLVGAGAKPNY